MAKTHVMHKQMAEDYLEAVRTRSDAGTTPCVVVYAGGEGSASNAIPAGAKLAVIELDRTNVWNAVAHTGNESNGTGVAEISLKTENALGTPIANGTIGSFAIFRNEGAPNPEDAVLADMVYKGNVETASATMTMPDTSVVVGGGDVDLTEANCKITIAYNQAL